MNEDVKEVGLERNILKPEKRKEKEVMQDEKRKQKMSMEI